MLQIGLTVLASLLVAVAAGWVLLVAAEANRVTFPLLVLFPLSIPIGLMLLSQNRAKSGESRASRAGKAIQARSLEGMVIAAWWGR